jgi:hypothetical protein
MCLDTPQEKLIVLRALSYYLMDLTKEKDSENAQKVTEMIYNITHAMSIK